MRAVNDLRLLVVLHIARSGRIGDEVNIRDLAELCRAYPDATVILAHVGRSYGPYFIEQALPELRDLPNLYYDLAALDSAESIDAVLRQTTHRRVLYASDLPVTLLRGRHLCVNRHCFFLTEEPCPNSITPEGDQEFAMTYMLYETVRAILRAGRRNDLGADALEDIFYNNTARLVESVEL
jgi:glutamate-1-semialdehyde 2,1-aminomutase